MTKCDMGTDCHAICDFCIHMAHNGVDAQGNRRPVDIILADYEGYCEKHQREQSELGQCEDYHCFRVGYEGGNRYDRRDAIVKGPEVTN